MVWRPAEAEGLVLQNDSWVAGLGEHSVPHLQIRRPPVIVQGTSVGFGAIRVREVDADGCVACLGQLKSIKLGDL